MKNKSASQQQDRGFSLIEVLAGIAIFSIAVFAIATLLTSSISANSKGRIVTEASAWASDRIERLMLVDYDDLESSAADVEENGYLISWVVTEKAMDLDNVKTVAVTVQDPQRRLKDFTFEFYRLTTY